MGQTDGQTNRRADAPWGGHSKGRLALRVVTELVESNDDVHTAKGHEELYVVWTSLNTV